MSQRFVIHASGGIAARVVASVKRWIKKKSHIADNGVHKNAHKSRYCSGENRSGNAHGIRDASPDALQWHTVT
jgi:hypothetical protein